MKIETTCVEITNGDYTYTASRMPNSSGYERWTLYRRLSTNANIPPYKQVFTNVGWQPVVNRSKGQVELFGSTDEVIEEIKGDDHA